MQIAAQPIVAEKALTLLLDPAKIEFRRETCRFQTENQIVVLRILTFASQTNHADLSVQRSVFHPPHVALPPAFYILTRVPQAWQTMAQAL